MPLSAKIGTILLGGKSQYSLLLAVSKIIFLSSFVNALAWEPRLAQRRLSTVPDGCSQRSSVRSDKLSSSHAFFFLAPLNCASFINNMACSRSLALINRPRHPPKLSRLFFS